MNAHHETLLENQAEVLAIRHSEIVQAIVARMEESKGRELTDAEFEGVSRIAYERALREVAS